jgi:methionyl-tRNA formyltransferase
MQITILCSSRNHPVWPRLESWIQWNAPHHTIDLVEKRSDVGSGDILFLISCNEIIRQDIRSRFRHVLVIHASDVPQGRGFAPLNWQILEGRNKVTVTLMEAADKVDSGNVWAKRDMHFDGHETFHELFDRLFETEIALMDFAVANCDIIAPEPQPETGGSYYRRRTPQDSTVEPDATIAQLFDLLRVSDPERYPVQFTFRGYRYALTMQKLGPAPPPQAVVEEEPVPAIAHQ